MDSGASAEEAAVCLSCLNLVHLHAVTMGTPVCQLETRLDPALSSSVLCIASLCVLYIMACAGGTLHRNLIDSSHKQQRSMSHCYNWTFQFESERL